MKQTKLFLTRTAAMLFAVLLSHAAWGGATGTFEAVDYNSEYENLSLNSGAFKVYLYTDHCAFEGLDAEGEEVWSTLGKTLAYNEDAYEGTSLFSMEYRGEKDVKVVPEVSVYWYQSSGTIFPTDATDLFDITFGKNQEYVVPVENYLDKNGNFNKNVPSVTISIKEKYKDKSVKFTSSDNNVTYFNLSGNPITKHYVITPKKLTLKALSIPKYDPKNDDGQRRYRFYNGQPVTISEFKPGGTMPDNGNNPNYGLYSVWMNGKQYSNTSSILFGGYEYFVRSSGVNVFVWDDNGKIDITNVSKDPVILSWGWKEDNSSLTIGQRTPGDYSTDDIATNNFDIKFEDGEVYISPLPIKVELTGDGYEKYFAKGAKEYYYDGNSVTVDGWTVKATNTAGKDVTSLLKFEPNTDDVMKCTSVKYNATSGDKWETWSTLTDNGEVRMKMVPESVEIDDDNFQLVEADDAITINQGGIKLLPRPITITTGDLKKAYDGTPLVATDEFELTEGTLATYNKKDEWIEINFTGSQTDPGTSANTAEAVVWRQGFGEEKMISQNDKGVSNYKITYDFGTLTVYGNEITVLIHGNQETLDYTGSTQTVKGYTFTLVPEDAKYSEKDFTFTGSARVQRRKIGTTYMELSADDFTNINKELEGKVGFVIEEQGSITIKYYDAELDDENGATEIDNIVYNKGGKANVTLTRSLIKDNEWNTLCLPFDVDLTAEDCPLAGADVRTLSDATLNGDNLSLTFTEEGAITTLEAGKPYLVKWEPIKGSDAPLFEAVAVTDELSDVEIELGDEKAIAFKGTYAPVKFTEADKSVLFVGDNSKLYYPLAGAHVDSERAYFQLTGFTVDDLQGGASAIGMRFDGTTGISNLMNAVEITYYDLSGRRVAQPTKGIYIANGKKVVIK